MEISKQTRLARPNSQARTGTREQIIFPVQLTTSMIGNLTRLIHTLLYVMCDQPGKVANPARGQLNRENNMFPCPRTRLRIWSRETGSVVPSRVSLLISILRPNLELTGFLPISASGLNATTGTTVSPYNSSV